MAPARHRALSPLLPAGRRQSHARKPLRKSVLDRRRIRSPRWQAAADMSWPRPCNPRPHPARAPPHRPAPRRSDARRLRCLPPMVSSTLFAPLLAIYRKRYPGVEIRLVENGIDRLEEILTAGDIDFAASTIPVAEGLEWQSVKLDPLMVLVPREFAARKKSIDLTDLKQMPFILFESGFAIS